jgi:prophage antirepressor-like protein
MTIQNVRGYMKNDTAYLNLEDVARGLGFVDGNSVRWVRVHSYLEEIGYFARSGDGRIKPNSSTESYVPENIFYRLAMKAKNEIAEIFQAKVADEILPSIRKHGMYAKDELLDNPDLLIQLATKLKEERQEKKLLQTENQMLAQENLKWANRKVIEAVIKKYGASKNKGPVGFADAWKEFKKELLYKYSINLNSRITNYVNDTGKKNVKTLDMIHDNELQACISTAVALCRQNKVDISDIISKFGKTA